MKSSKGASPLQLGPGSPVFAGPFKKNLSALFRMNGEKVKFTQMKHAWAHMVQVKYRSADGRETNLKLHFYTEVLAPEYDNIVCDECRIMGWQGHCVGTKRVHVILPSEKTLANPRTLMSLMEMRHRGWMHRARLDASKIAREKEDDTGDGTAGARVQEFVAAENMFHSKTHLLHGVFHMNGYGHLCRVNGREGGSSKYTGTELMHVWDDLCTVLRARVVSVEDVSNKLTMELRILLPIAYDQTWYGRWAYNFGRAPFNINALQWADAVRQAAGVKLSDLIDFCTVQTPSKQSKPRKGWKSVLAVLRRYHMARLLPGLADMVGVGDSALRPLQTVGDLLHVMLDALRCPSEALRSLIVAPGMGGQNPHEKELLDLKAPQNGEEALIEAYNTQDQPPLAQLLPEELNEPSLKGANKRSRKTATDDDVPYTPAPKRKKKAACLAPVNGAVPKCKPVPKANKKAARLAEIDTPVADAPTSGSCKRRDSKAREKDVAVLAYEGLAEPSSVDARSGKDRHIIHAGATAEHEAEGMTASDHENPPHNLMQRKRVARNRQPSLRLFDYDDPGHRAPTQRTSPSKGRRSAVRPGSSAHATCPGVVHPPQPSVSKSGRKRTRTLRAELAAAAEASENGFASPDAATSIRSVAKTVTYRSSSFANAHIIRPVSTGKEAAEVKHHNKKGAATTDTKKVAPHVRVQPAAKHTSGNGAPAPSAAVEVWCENINNLAPGGCIGQKYATDSSVRNQIMSDLLCVYFALFRTDVSENVMQHFTLLGSVAAASGADLTRPPPQSTNKAVTDLRSAMATLRYTKHFEKDYKGTHPHPSRPVRNINTRPSKKKTPTATEMRFLVTVLPQFSFTYFGGPEAVVEQTEEDTRDSGQDEDVRKAGNPVAEADAPMLSRAATRATRAAASRDAPVQVSNAPILKPEVPSHAVENRVAFVGQSNAHDSGTGPRDEVQTTSVNAAQDSSSLILDSLTKDTSLTRFVETEALHAMTMPGSDFAVGVTGDEAVDNCAIKHELLQGVERVTNGLAPHSGRHEDASNAFAHSWQELRFGISGVHPLVARKHCKCTMSGVHLHARGESHGSYVDTACCATEVNSGQGYPQIPCSGLFVPALHRAAYGSAPCTCAAVRNSPDGCSHHEPRLTSAGKALYSTELQAVASEPTLLPIRFRPPPSELVVMSASTTVAEFKRAIAVALRDTYYIFQKFQVVWIHCPALIELASSSHPPPNVSEPMPFVHGCMPADKDKIERHLPGPTDEPIRLFVAGPGLDLDSAKLRHAGGEANWVVLCKCGVQDDDGERMLCCDKCSNWVHGLCEGIADSEPDPKAFTCYRCRRSPLS